MKSQHNLTHRLLAIISLLLVCATLFTACNQGGIPTGTSGEWFSFQGYVSKMEVELLQGNVGWALSFNIVQSKGASWQ